MSPGHFLLLVILLPIIPAVVLFKFLPSTAAVKGPFQGLRVDLTGGFGGYFLIFLVLIGLHSQFMGTTYEKWVVKGQIFGTDSKPLEYVDQRYVTLSTPSMRADSLDNLSMAFFRSSDGAFDYPHLNINYPDTQRKSYWLGPAKENSLNEISPVNFDEKTHTINLGRIDLVKSIPPSGGPDSPTANPYNTPPVPQDGHQ